MKTAIIVICALVAFVPMVVAIVMYLNNKAKINWFKYENKKKQAGFTKENETARQNEIVMIGDSIIDLYDTKDFYRDIVVYNRGISGDTTTNMLDRLYRNALSIKPRKLFILIGTNDISKNIDKETTLLNIRSMIEITLESGVKDVYVESLYPVNVSVDKAMVAMRTNEFIRGINEELKALCAELGVTYINIHDLLTDSDGNFDREYTVDGLHPNHNGYEVVTHALRQYIYEDNNEEV